MKRIRFLCLGSLALTALACSPPSMSSPDGQDDAAVAEDSQSPPPDDGSSTDSASPTFPAVCQERAVECPDMASLDRCEMGLVNNGCSDLPLIDCVRDPSDFHTQGSCPSHAQVCRITDGNQGFCTHSCVNDSQCPLPGGGTGTCSSVGPTTICMRN